MISLLICDRTTTYYCCATIFRVFFHALLLLFSCAAYISFFIRICHLAITNKLRPVSVIYFVQLIGDYLIAIYAISKTKKGKYVFLFDILTSSITIYLCYSTIIDKKKHGRWRTHSGNFVAVAWKVWLFILLGFSHHFYDNIARIHIHWLRSMKCVKIMICIMCVILFDAIVFLGRVLNANRLKVPHDVRLEKIKKFHVTLIRSDYWKKHYPCFILS